MTATMRQGDSNPEGFEWIELADFSAGIHGDHFGADHSRMLDGAATIDNTYGCYADGSGALAPLPAAESDWTQVMLPKGNTDAYVTDSGGEQGHFPPGQVQCHILDGVFGQAHRASPWIVVAYGYWLGPDKFSSDSDRYWHVHFRRYDWVPAFQGPPRTYTDLLFLRGATAAGFIGGGSSAGSSHDQFRAGYPNANKLYAPNGAVIEWARVADADDNPPTVADTFGAFVMAAHPGGGVFLEDDADFSDGVVAGFNYDDWTYSNYGTIYGPGTIAVDTGWSNGIAEGVAVCPDPAVGNSSFDVLTVTANAITSLMCAHQGRIVMARAEFGDFSTDGQSDYIEYTQVLRIADTDTPTLLTGEENPSGIGAMGSLTADELLIIKHTGGGVLIRGDLDNPQVVRLPFLESTYGVITKGAATPVGFVYGTRNGVFAYTGGASSQHLSPQLDGWFWNYFRDEAFPDYRGNMGRFHYWHPFICVPFNYLMDTRSGGWWRLEDPSNTAGTGGPPFKAYDTRSTNGDLIAFHSKITPTWNYPWHTYSWDTLRSYYTWQSQPLVRTRRDNLLFRQLEVVATAHPDATNSTVTITLTGYDRDGAALTPASVTFNLAENGHISYRIADIVNFQARYVQVRIEAESDTGPAPKVHAMRLATVPGNPIPKG